MLERLSVSVEGARQKTSKAVGDRLNVFGAKKQVPFHIVISELRAELMNVKQHVPGQPCVLLWVRGDTTHATEDSVGQTVLSWSDTYFAQVVPLQVSGSGFRSKECKFKVQQKGRTIAKTVVIDLTKYCSEIGLARDQTVSVPLQPSGTLYFVISTAPASEQQQQQANDMLARQSTSKSLMRASHNPSVGGGGGGAAASALASLATGALGHSDNITAPSAEGNRQRHSHSQEAGQYASTAAKYGGTVVGAAAAAASSLVAAVTPPGLGKGRGGTPETGPSPDDADRASSSGRGHWRRPSGGQGTGWAAGLTAATAVVTGGPKSSPTTPSTYGPDGGGSAADDKIMGAGVFKRKSKASAGKPSTAFAGTSGAVAASTAAAGAVATGVGGSGGRKPLTQQLTLRKSDSDNVISDPGAEGRISWAEHAERSLSQAMVGSNGRQARGSGSGYATAHRAIRSFTGTPAACAGGGGAAAAWTVSSPLQQLQLPHGAVDGLRNLARASGAASICSDTAASAVAGANAGKGADGGGGWGTWLRSGLGWGRSSNPSVGTASGAASQSPLATGALGAGGTGVGSAATATERESSNALEAAIRSATELLEVRELALDLLHERDGWRARALAAQDAAARAQTSRGSAVREAQRLEVRLRQYQDELGRRTDGSLLQELVEAKVRIAELANENMKLRRQITHMGPLFYDDSGDDTAQDAKN